jgi:hypothetical protein
MSYTNGLDKPTDYFNTKLYTGTGSSQSITGVGFQPDWVWIKPRSVASSHTQIDSVRGANGSVMRTLFSNLADAEESTTSDTNLAYGVVNSIDSDGFTVGSGVTADGRTNQSGQTYASWNWLAGGTASSNTDGSITSSVSANTTSGFSIVSYTGNGSTNQTIGTGLGAIPDFIIVKQRNTTRNWPTYSRVLGNGVAFLDVTDAWDGGASYQNYWYTSGMTSSTFGISDNVNTNTSGGTYIAYCFAEKKGFSKFGSYTGNGNADGTFVYTGFKPAFTIIKQSSASGENWPMHDNKRNTFNPESLYLYANSFGAEAT